MIKSSLQPSPNGYRALVVTRGKDVPTEKFDSMVKAVGQDAFLVEAFEGGEPRATNVDKAVWYCMYDIMSCLKRRGRGASFEESSLIIEAENFILDYLETQHGIDMRSVVRAE